MRVDEVLELDEAKAFLNIRTAVNDDELESFIPAAIARVERHLDEQLVDVEVTETLTACYGVLTPSRRPVKSVTSASAGGYTWAGDALTVDALLPAVSVSDTYSSVGVYGAFYGPVELTYVAGRTSVTAAEKLAIKAVLAEYWRSQRVTVGSGGGASYASGVALEADATPTGTAPMRVRLQEILGPAAAARP